MSRLLTITSLALVLLSGPHSSFSQLSYTAYLDSLKIRGSTTVYDYKNHQWYFTDSLDARRETLPASTFKILNSLIALETKAVRDENEVIPWDGKEKTFFGTPIAAWNQDTDLKTAYKNSTVWFFVEMARRMGRKTYRRYVRQCHYGNGNLQEKGIDFWNYGNFGISPQDQIRFLRKLYQNHLPFSQKTMTTVKEIMISATTQEGVYHDKSGWTKKEGQDIGWWIGYLETPTNVYFFATRLIKSTQDENSDFSKARMEATKILLRTLLPKTL